MPLLARQPFKAVATLTFLLSLPPYAIALCVYYALKRNRPHPGWSLKTSLRTKMLRLFYYYATSVRFEPDYANAKKLKDRFVMVQPGPSKLYTQILQDNLIKPSAMPAMWFPCAPGGAESKKFKSGRVVIHLQGGAFVVAPEPSEIGQPAANYLAEKLDAMTFYPQYRLARNEQTRFPAALQDAVTFYKYVLDQGYEPQDIIISGDSAGGNVIIGLLRYIESLGMLPAPAGAMLWSPWVDVSEQSLTRHAKSKQRHTDFLALSFVRWGVQAVTPRAASKETEPYLRPALHPFSCSVPVFVNAGTAELLYDEINQFVEGMKGIEGNKIHYVETKGAPHDLILAGNVTGFTAEAAEAVQEAGKFFGL